MVSGLSAAELSALQDRPRPDPSSSTSPPPSTSPASSTPARPVEVVVGPSGLADTLAAPAALVVADTPPAPAPGPVEAATPIAAPQEPAAGVGPGPSAADLARERSRLLRGILAFIAGFTVIFTILGASASAVGRLFLTHQRTLETVSGILIVVFGAVLVAMAAGLPLPLALSGERRFAVRPSVLGAWAPPIMGMAFAFSRTPCIGPVLASVLALAAGTGGSATGGIALLLAYSLGLGVPFLVSGLAFGRMTDVLARVRSRLRLVDLVGGTILVVFGILLLTGNVDVISAHISNWLHDLHLDRLSVS
jgi:cytochrome c-type biogenesis protein